MLGRVGWSGSWLMSELWCFDFTVIEIELNWSGLRSSNVIAGVKLLMNSSGELSDHFGSL